MVLNQLMSGPQSDSLMADEADEAEGSGEGSGTDAGGPGRSGWGGNDDDDNTDEYSSGDGSGDSITTQPPSIVNPNGNVYFAPSRTLSSTRRTLNTKFTDGYRG